MDSKLPEEAAFQPQGVASGWDEPDIVERLNGIEWCHAVPVCREAATTIAQLRADNAKLVEERDTAIAAEKAVLDRLRNLPDDVASYIAQKHCFSYEVAKIVGKDLATALADAMEANNGY